MAIMLTRVYLIRHGTTAFSAADRFSGATDVALAEEGERQAARLGRRLAQKQIAALYCSPLQRARQTAALVVPHLTPIPCADLREIDYGHWETRPRREVAEQFAAEYAAWQADPYSRAPLGGETGAAVLARALPALRRIVADHPNQAVAVVAHKSTIRLLLCGLLGLDPHGYRDRLEQYPACLNIIDFRDATRAQLVLYNDVSHYAAEDEHA